MRVKVLNPCSYDEVAEDGQNLIGIQHPFLFLETVHRVKLLDLQGDAF